MNTPAKQRETAMTADEYVPSDDDVRIEYVLAHQGLEAQLDAGEAYDRWLAAHDARVRRDAARSGYYHGYNDRRLERDYNHAYPEETP